MLQPPIKVEPHVWICCLHQKKGDVGSVGDVVASGEDVVATVSVWDSYSISSGADDVPSVWDVTAPD